jgi:hypothetical protein
VSGVAVFGQLVQRGQARLFTKYVVLVAAERLANDLAAAGVSAVGDLVVDKALLVFREAEVSARIRHRTAS